MNIERLITENKLEAAFITGYLIIAFFLVRKYLKTGYLHKFKTKRVDNDLFHWIVEVSILYLTKKYNISKPNFIVDKIDSTTGEFNVIPGTQLHGSYNYEHQQICIDFDSFQGNKLTVLDVVNTVCHEFGHYYDHVELDIHLQNTDNILLESSARKFAKQNEKEVIKELWSKINNLRKEDYGDYL